MDINSQEFAKQLNSIIRSIVRDEFKKLVLSSLRAEDVGKVVASSGSATVDVYINDSTTAVPVRNPRGLNLSKNQLVAIRYPNFRNDGMKYVDRVL